MEWTVSKQKIELHPHANADLMEIARVGTAQMVVQKGLYQNGDVVLIIAAKSIIPPGPMLDEFDKMLTGKADARRVKAVRLRGEYSEAITWPLDNIMDVYTDAFNRGYLPEDITFESGLYAIQNAEIGENIAQYFGIKKYVPEIPSNMNGQVAVFEDINIKRHDCYHLASYVDEIPADERVVVTEKLHGTQILYALKATGAEVVRDENGVVVDVIKEPTLRELVTSKGRAADGLEILDEPGQLYWEAARNSNLRYLCKNMVDMFSAIDENCTIQIIGEVVPSQKGYTYGLDKPVVKVFDVVVDVEHKPFHLGYDTPLWPGATPQTIFDWVPVLYDGVMGSAPLVELSKGKETVSGKGLHIKEGCVVRPYDTTRKDSKGNIRLHLKIINPKYSDNDEETN